MADTKLLSVDTIDCMIWDIMDTVKADIKTLDDKYDDTDEYQYYQDARDLEKLNDKLESVAHHIRNIIQEYRP